MTAQEIEDLVADLEYQNALEEVSPKCEHFRAPAMIKGARGGRAAGAKSWGMSSLLVQRAHRTPIRVACLREVQKSIEESVYELIRKTVRRLQYSGWVFRKNYIESACGARFAFKGLSDLRLTQNIKGLEGFDVFYIEEAATIARESWDVVLPTLFRRSGAELWFCYNPESEIDPVTKMIWEPFRDDPKAILLDMQPGAEDNPWWNEQLQFLSDKMKAEDPERWEHIYGGKPKRQGEMSVMSRAAVRQAMARRVQAVGPLEIGCDVARFGDDKIVAIARRGLAVERLEVWSKLPVDETARRLFDMANGDKKVLIKVDDTGVGGGVTDHLQNVMGANALPVNFGGRAHDTERYTTVADELWFGFPVEQCQLPSDDLLFEELTERRYKILPGGQRKIEPKAEFKKRIGRSPDRGDALLLAFYDPRAMVYSSLDDAVMIAPDFAIGPKEPVYMGQIYGKPAGVVPLFIVREGALIAIDEIKPLELRERYPSNPAVMFLDVGPAEVVVAYRRELAEKEIQLRVGTIRPRDGEEAKLVGGMMAKKKLRVAFGCYEYRQALLSRTDKVVPDIVAHAGYCIYRMVSSVEEAMAVIGGG